jgi:hypothetical protein
MNALLFYILKLSICLSIVYLFYQLVLRRLTFYNWNRWYLLLFTGLAFVLPIIDLSPLLQEHAWNDNPVVEIIPVVGGYTTDAVQAASPIREQAGFSMEAGIVGCLAAGILIMLVRLLIQYWSLYRIRRSASLLVNDGVKIYQVNQTIIPFSFGNAIYLNQQLHTDDELKDIVHHEFIHVKQRHSIDMIWGELLCMLNWYNPFIWLTRNAMRQNLEFIADNQVLQTGIDRKQYQYLLLKVVGVPSFSIASNFNFSSLKKRIAMMNKTKSARVNLVRFLCMLPVMAVILLGFRTIVPAPSEALQQAPVTDTLPAAKKQGLPEHVRSVRIYNGRATVTLKNGQVEKYNLDNVEEKEAFEDKYGAAPPPPPPPGSPVPMTPAMDDRKPLPSAAPKPGKPAPVNDQNMPTPPSPPNVENTPLPVAPDRPESMPAPPAPPTPPPYKMPKGVKSFYIRYNKAKVILDNGKMESYDLGKPDEKAAFEKKFGEMPPPPKVDHPAAVTPVAPVRAISPATPIDPVPAPSTEKPDAIIVQASHVAPSQGDEDPQAESAKGHKSGILVLTPTQTAEQLDQIKKDLDEKGFTLRFDDVHHKDGKLVAIKGIISHGNKKASFDAKNFRKVVISFKRGAGFRLNMLDDGHITFNN